MLAFGDSISVAAGLPDPSYAYPAKIAAALGVGLNSYGISGATIYGDFGSPSILAEIQGILVPDGNNFAVMNVGTNDMAQNASDPAHIALFSAGLEIGLRYLTSHRRVPDARTVQQRLQLRQGKLPSIADGSTVWVGNCIRMGASSAYYAQSIAAIPLYNTAISLSVSRMVSEGRRVRLVDISAALDPTTGLQSDGIHPTAAGQIVIANTFLAAMAS